jgi:hypothetical protein
MPLVSGHDGYDSGTGARRCNSLRRDAPGPQGSAVHRSAMLRAAISIGGATARRSSGMECRR